jgi:adenylate cyclase
VGVRLFLAISLIIFGMILPLSKNSHAQAEPRKLNQTGTTLALFEESLRQSREQGNDVGIAQNLQSIGNLYYKQNDFPRAIDYMLQSLRIFQKIGDQGSELNSILTIGEIYYAQKNNRKAKNQFLKAVTLSRELNNKRNLARALSNLGKIEQEKKNFAATYTYFGEALPIFKALKDNQGLADIYTNLGHISYAKKEYDNALELYVESYKLLNFLMNKKDLGDVEASIAKVYIGKEDYASALKYLISAEQLALEVKSYEELSEINRLYNIYYEHEGNIIKAFSHYKAHMLYRDSVVNIENAKKVLYSSMQHEYEVLQYRDSVSLAENERARDYEQSQMDLQKEEEIKRQKLMTYAGIFASILLLMLAGIIFLGYMGKKKANETISNEKQRSDELLLNILPEETAEEIKRTGSAQARYFELVTVIFTDFKAFTSVAEQLSPEELVAEIDYCYKKFDNIIDKHRIEKIKTIGDAYMCAGGLPKPDTDNPLRAVKAALAIRDFIEEHRENRQKEGKPAFEIRIGVHTGPVVAGVVGHRKFAYDIWGDTVNVAARMESSCEPGMVNISNATYEFVKDKMYCVHRGKVHAKNKGEVDMYFVESLDKAPSTTLS